MDYLHSKILIVLYFDFLKLAAMFKKHASCATTLILSHYDFFTQIMIFLLHYYEKKNGFWVGVVGKSGVVRTTTLFQ